ncbi:uncharacterized protein LOC102790481 [Neolamprologus brichardi]|uniref:uncharacterized protein LOC102790481 n=1 Tax=Neolamprologus brichardi TaxID=32507 RepID=UPI001643A44F|nr:uncharacterized protein LOC102790481 [Neolamprologus brichardi]
MDDIKLYAKSKQDSESLIQATRIYSKDTGMSFLLEKCSQTYAGVCGLRALMRMEFSPKSCHSQIEQDFRLLFCEVTASKFLERWPTNLKAKVVKESHGLVPTSELLELMCNAESGTEVENGWDSDLSTILLLLHLLPPSAQGRKRPGKMSASQAVNNLIKFPKAGTSVQQHLDNITRSSQPYLLTQGSTRSSIHTFIVIEKHALPCKATGSVGALDELFRAHYVFGTSYSSSLTNFFTFLQTTTTLGKCHIAFSSEHHRTVNCKGLLR